MRPAHPAPLVPPPTESQQVRWIPPHFNQARSGIRPASGQQSFFCILILLFRFYYFLSFFGRFHFFLFCRFLSFFLSPSFYFFSTSSLSFYHSSLTLASYTPSDTMSAKSILEADGKAILNYHLTRAPVIKPTPLPPSTTHNPPPRLASIYFPEDAAVKDVLNQAEIVYPWLLTPGAKFVAKPDQLIKRRGKSGLLALNKTWAEAKEWIEARAAKDVQVETVTGVLRQFLVEPFVPHPEGTEYYINIHSVREVSFTAVAAP